MRKMLYSLLGSRALNILLVILILFISASFLASAVIRSKVRQELSELRKKSIPVSCSEIIPPNVSSSENGASLYMAAIDIADLGELRFEGEPGEFASYYQTHRGEIMDALNRNDLTFRLLEEGYKKPECRYDLDYRDGFYMRVLNYMHIRYIAWLMSCKAAAEIERGDYGQASLTLAEALKFIRTLQPDSTLTQAMRISLRRFLLGALRLLTASGKHLASAPLEGEIDFITGRGEKELQAVLYGERVLGLDFFSEMERKGLSHLTDTDMEEFKHSPFLIMELYLPGKPLLYYDELSYMRQYEGFIQGWARGEKKKEDIKSSPFCVIDSIVLPNIPSLIEKNREVREEYRSVENRMRQ